MRARDVAASAAELLIQEYIDPTAGLALAERRIAKTKVPLKQRGRTAPNTTFDSKHPRGYHGRFAAGSGGGGQPSSGQIKAFQRSYGLTPTGQLDAATRATMKAPPPKTVSQLKSSEKQQQVKAAVQKATESKAMSEAVRKAKGEPPVGSSKGSSKGTSTKAGSAGTGSTRSEELKRTNKERATRESGERTAARRASGEIPKRSSRASAEGATRKATAGLAGKQAINHLREANAWQGKLNVKEDLALGKGMQKGEQPSPAVGLAQAKLQALGYNLGSAGIDGKFGPATETAVRVLQREYGIPTTGRVEARTLQLLETLTERAGQQAQHGIIAAELVPGESVVGAVRRVVAVSAL